MVYRDGEMRRTHHEVRVPTLPEYSEWVRAAGFSTVEFYGQGASPPTIDDMRVVVVARR